MKLKRLIYIFSLLLLDSSKLNAQVEAKVDSGLQWLYKNYPQEKIYVHTDKDNYIAGQSLWFSIYSISYGMPTTISKIVYIELISPEGTVVAQAKLPMDKGMANGDLILPDSLRSDAYELRCFTAWMLNFDEHFIFRKVIYIQNPAHRSYQSPRKISNVANYHIDFFPEGGDLVDGNLCNLAFKATDANGLPVELSGEIEDEQKSHVATLQIVHDGMGEFSIIPHIQHRYYGSLHFPDGATMTVQLPEIKAFGITFKVIEQNDQEINIAIFHHDGYINDYQDLVLAAYQNNGQIAVYPLRIEKGKNIFSIKKAQFASGILRLTVFSSAGAPLAERVLFIDKEDKLKIVLVKDSLSFAPRSKNMLTIQIKNAYPEKSTAYFSVAVTDPDKVVKDSLSDNICSAFFLSSELKGYVHDPAYYFMNDDEKRKKALDLVMLTNGWRHFKWEDALNEKPLALKYAVEKEQYLEGEIAGYNKALNRQALKLKILIQNEDSSKFIGYAEPDSNGRFILRDYAVKGRSTVFFEVANSGKRKAKDIKVQFYSSSQDSFRTAPYFSAPLDSMFRIADDTDEISFLLRQQKGMLKPVIVKGHLPTKTEQVIAKYVGSDFKGNGATSIDFINNFYPNNNRLFDFLKGKFPGVTITGREDAPIFEYEGSASMHNQKPDSNGIATAVPYFFVDEILTTWEDVKNITFSDIALMQFLPPPVAMAPLNGGFRGVITIYLKKGDEALTSSGISENYNHYSFNGFSITREFYSPDYNIRKIDMSVPDVRSTLYWNPKLVLDPNGEAHFQFFSSDKAKRFCVSIEGMDAQGKIGSFVTITNAN